MPLCLQDNEVDALWRKYRGDPASDARDGLIAHYLPHVGQMAARLRSTLPDSVELDDLVSYGLIGLMDAIEKFDTSRGVRFEAYAARRIRGAIIDGLRAVDWLPRSVRTKARCAERAREKLEHCLLRSPTDREVASEIGVTEADLSALQKQIAAASMLQLDKSIDVHSDKTLGDQIADDGPSPEGRIEAIALQALLAGAVQRLGERERSVVEMYYFDGMNLAAIADRLKVTEGRICQIRGDAIDRLRIRLWRILRESA